MSKWVSQGDGYSVQTIDPTSSGNRNRTGDTSQLLICYKGRVGVVAYIYPIWL